MHNRNSLFKSLENVRYTIIYVIITGIAVSEIISILILNFILNQISLFIKLTKEYTNENSKDFKTEIHGFYKELDDLAQCFKKMVEPINDRETRIINLSQFKESIIENADIWLEVIDNQLNVFLWNKTAENISGYTKEEVLDNAGVWEKIYSSIEYRNEIKQDITKFFHEDTQLKKFETVIHCKITDGKVIQWSLNKLKDADNKIIGSDVVKLIEKLSVIGFPPKSCASVLWKRYSSMILPCSHTGRT